MSNDGRLAGKVAVVTGGGNGLGHATAVRFAEEGAAVVVADLLDGPGHETVAQIEAAGGRAAFVSVDVDQPRRQRCHGPHRDRAVRRPARRGHRGRRRHRRLRLGRSRAGAEVDARTRRTRSGAGVRRPRPRRLAVGARRQPHRHAEVPPVLCRGDARPRLCAGREPDHHRVDRGQASRRRIAVVRRLEGRRVVAHQEAGARARRAQASG